MCKARSTPSMYFPKSVYCAESEGIRYERVLQYLEKRGQWGTATFETYGARS